MTGSMSVQNKLHLVIDTNVLLVSIPERSPYHWLYRALIEGRFCLHVTVDILAEYEEIISQKLSPQVAGATLRMLAELENVSYTNIHFSYSLINQDLDDNKFVNCAINANAHFIVTHDRHFNILREINFPRVHTIDIHKLQELLTDTK